MSPRQNEDGSITVYEKGPARLEVPRCSSPSVSGTVHVVPTAITRNMSTAAAESYVNTGVWTNWSHGRVLGATLTLSQRSGAVLAAFLAIFVSFAGSMFWQILSYAIHQALATEPGSKSDGLHQQRQVILRNSSTAGTALWKITTLAQAWQGHAPRSLLRLAPFIFLAAVNIAAFSLASIFTSAVTTAPGTAVLIRGPSCGRVLDLDALGDQAASQAKLAGDTYEAATYARQCYQSESPGPACGAFPSPRLTYAADGNASCPFVSGLCYFSDTAAFSMDTGLLDSHGDLGVNAPPEHRVQFRRVTTCAPLHPGRWTRIENDTRYGGEVIYLEAGPWKPYTNYTFFYPHRARGDNFGYTLQLVPHHDANLPKHESNPTTQLSRIVFAIAGYQAPEGGWEPDESLNRTDANVVLLMLNQNTVSYLKPSDDPWMPAHQLIPPTNMTEPIWISDYDATVLGCAEQYQFCNPNNGKCTKLTGHQHVFRDLPLGDEWNEFQQATMNRIIIPAIRMNLENAIAGRGGAALNGRFLLVGDLGVER